MEVPNDKKLLTLQEASKMLGMNAQTLRRWDKAGKLPAIKVGRRKDRRYRLEDLKKILAINPKAKGSLLEEVLEELIIALLKEWQYEPVIIRTQTSGSQFGKDNVSKWKKTISGNNEQNTIQEYDWSFEAKNYGTITRRDIIPPTEIRSKAFDIQDSSVPLDVWCIFSPFGVVDNSFFETINRKHANRSLPFRIVLWTRDRQIERLISCFPEIYRKLYDKEPTITPKERTEILLHWKQEVELETKEGRVLRNNTPLQLQNLNVKNVGDIAKTVVKEIRSEIERSITDTASSQDLVSAYDSIEKSEMKEEIEHALSYLNKGETGQAKERFFLLLGKLQGKQGLIHEQARVYNNIGVAFNIERKTDEAIAYFKKAIAIEKDFIKPQTNLASCYLLKVEDLKQALTKEDDQSGKKLIEGEISKILQQAKDIILPLWQKFGETYDPETLQKYLHLIRVESGVEEVVSFIENKIVEPKFKSLLNTNSTLAYIAGVTYLANFKPEEALSYANIAIKLDKDVETLLLRGRTRIALALKNDANMAQDDYEDITPSFIRYINLRKAQTDFEEAMEIALKKEEKIWYSDLGYFLKLTNIWLGNSEYKGKQPNNLENENSSLGDQFLKTIQLFREGEIELSFNSLKSLPEFNTLPYEEIFRYARVYLNNGFPEIALELFNRIQNKSIERNDYRLWMDMSVIYVLLNYKNQAILSASKAKELTKQSQRRVSYSHFGAVMMRYANEEGGDRLLENALEFNSEFPELNVVKAIDIDKDRDFIIKTATERAEWIKNIKEIYKDHPLPTYYLQNIFKTSYVEIWKGRDPEMTFDYTVNNEAFLEEMQQNFSKGKTFIFDYLSLLTLSKLNLLNDLEKLFPEMQISFSLFQKIQDELIRVEDPYLRRLWEFLRKSNSIKKIKRIPTKELKDERIDDLFESWLIDEMKMAKVNKAVMITDDFRLLRILKSEPIQSINTWFILQKVHKSGLFDDRMYSRAIGDLASYYYQFLGFNGDDMYTIIADDNFKLKPRSFHLINQIFLTGTDYKSFSQVFAKFIFNLWKAGTIDEDKIYWLGYLSDILGELVEKKLALVQDAERKVILSTSEDFGHMWSIALREGNFEELKKLKIEFPNMLNRKIFIKAKESIGKRLDERLKELSK